MTTTAAFASTAGACAFVAVALATPASAGGGARNGIYLDAPALEGRKAALPDGRSAGIVTEELQHKYLDGPAPGARRVALPAAPMHPRP